MRLERRYASAAQAQRLWRAIATDHPEYVTGGVDHERLVLEVRGPSAASVRMSIDDLLACLIAAEATERGRTAPAPR